ncbi:hypothetical protein [Streptomyces lunaelactis]|uniref:hypothetical protein n=1 Tax=Streptomyces lunaelactis TaxID=1535768 RepID=UPI0015845461|nr:hypothetical protein [Streptomyces lunaelactis]NUK22064.1 hypothetical protein [Streptomyces lunaelactis]
MHRNTLARARLDGAGWAHPYTDPFVCYADSAAGDASGSTGTGPGSDPGGSPGGSPNPGGQPGSWEGFQWDGKVDSLPEPVAKVIREAREEAGKARTVAKQNAAAEARQQMAQDIGKALGLVEGDKAPTPEELTTQLRDSQTAITSAQEQAAAAAIELHVYKTAARLGADADALLDSRAFCDTIDALDPGQAPEQFNGAVQQAIEAALHRNPGMRARTAGRSGADLGGGGSGDQHASLDKQIAEAQKKRDFATVIRLKRQRAATT